MFKANLGQGHGDLGDLGQAMESILVKKYSSQNTYITLLVKNILWSNWQQTAPGLCDTLIQDNVKQH